MPDTLNIDRLLQVARAIEAPHARFDMLHTSHPCGSPGCIAGHTLALFATDTPEYEPPLHKATRLLGLSHHQSLALFTPSDYTTPHYRFTAAEGQGGYITADHAARVLRHLATTGVIDWDLTSSKGHPDAPCHSHPPSPPHR